MSGITAPQASNQHTAQIGFGCSGAWGEKWFSERKAISLVHSALAEGVTHFDTGSFYCQGNAEQRLGKALTAYGSMIDRLSLCISSKTGTHVTRDGRLFKDFSREAICRDVETSLGRLGVDALDILYLHGPNKHELFSSIPTLVELKRQKLIRAIGVCTNDSIAKVAASTNEVDVVMASINLFNQDHLSALTLAKENGKKTVAIAAMAQGLYKRGLFFPKTLAEIWYLARALSKGRQELYAAQQVRWVHKVENWSAAEIVLAYALHLSQLDVVMTSTTKLSNLQQNINVMKRPLPPELISRLYPVGP